jgi:TetR/AcrR family transcriptional regulator, cholesterol catabolism regulator
LCGAKAVVKITALARNHCFGVSMSRVQSRVKDKELVDERRRAIVEGAISVFKQKGYSKATVREIAQAAHLGTGSIYDYVKSKDDILYLFYENYMNSFYEKLMKSAGANDDPRYALAGAYRSLIEVCFELEDQVMLAYTQAMYMKNRYLKNILAREVEIVDTFKTILIDCGLPDREAALTANYLVFSATFGVLRRWNLKKYYTRQELTEYLIHENIQKIMETTI